MQMIRENESLKAVRERKLHFNEEECSLIFQSYSQIYLDKNNKYNKTKPIKI